MKEVLSFDKNDYEGASASTLCLGCGHDQISKNIIRSFHEAGIDPFSIAKISGIGCSSKTPNYFLKQSKGFNSIHGRMACVATGVKSANKNLTVIGVSGDGDTGSIGLGSFLHTVRKNIPMIYIVENNGVYGLTKGQFSATAQKNSQLKNKESNPFYSMDLCNLALSAGCGFVARSFSGDSKQLTVLLKLALKYEGFAFIDVISPCVAYGNQSDFAHSFSFMKEKRWPLHEIDIIFDNPTNTNKQKLFNKTDHSHCEDSLLESEDNIKIPLPDDSFLMLKKLRDHDPTKKDQAQKVLSEDSQNQSVATGLIYYQKRASFLEQMNLSEKALIDIQEIQPPSKSLLEILNHYR